MDKPLDISKDAQWLLPSRQATPALLPCNKGGDKRVVGISPQDTGGAAPCPLPDATSKCPTGRLLPKHGDSWVQHQGPTSPSDETPVYGMSSNSSQSGCVTHQEANAGGTTRPQRKQMKWEGRGWRSFG